MYVRSEQASFDISYTTTYMSNEDKVSVSIMLSYFTLLYFTLLSYFTLLYFTLLSYFTLLYFLTLLTYVLSYPLLPSSSIILKSLIKPRKRDLVLPTFYIYSFSYFTLFTNIVGAYSTVCQSDEPGHNGPGFDPHCRNI